MAEMDDLVEILNLFPINSLKDEWVKGVWDSDFTEAELDDDILLDINSDEQLDALDRLRTNLTAWVTQHTEEGVWTMLVEKDISLKAVVAFLCYLILAGHKTSAHVKVKLTGIAAARAYSKLVLVPGSSAFKVFHPVIYEKSVDFLKQMVTLGSSGTSKRKRSITPVKSSQGKRNSKSRRKHKNNSLGDDEDSVLDGEDDEEVDEELTPQDVNKIRKHLNSLLVDLISFLEGFSLRQSVSSAYHTVQIFAQLTRLDVEYFDGNFESSTRIDKLSVPALAFKGLQCLCSPHHGQVLSMMNATCKYLLPSVLMLVGDKSVQTINKGLQLIRDHAINFICFLMAECGDRGLASVRTLLQHMCTKVTDRAEYRTRVAQAIVKISQALPAESYSKMVQWFYKLSKHNQMNNRGFAIEIVSALLATPEKPVTADVPVELIPYTSHRSLLGILLDRCSDKAPTVRARAITCFAQCLGSKDGGITGTVRDIVTPQVGARVPNMPRLIKTPGAPLRDRTVTDETTELRSEVTIAQQTTDGSTIATEKGGVGDGQTPLNRVQLTPGFDPNLSDSDGVFSMLRRRARDDKVLVRKAALMALEGAVRFEAPNYTKQNVEILKDHCRDPGLSVRKQSMQSLTDLLMDMPKVTFIQSIWLSGVLPLVIDRETTLSEKCMETLEELVLSNIIPFARCTGESHVLAWSMLDIIADPHSVDQRRYLQKACHHWSRIGKIKPGLLNALETHIGTKNNAGAWMLLAEMAPAAPKMNHKFLLNYWQDPANIDCSSEIMERVLIVMKCVAKHLPVEDRDRLISDLKSRLMKFNSPPELISVSVSTLSKLCTVQAKEKGDNSLKIDWCNDLMSASDKYLSKVVLEEGGKPKEQCTAHNEDLIVCHLFTLGEVVQLCPGKVPKRVFLLVQSMIATPCITSLPASQSQPATQTEDNQSAHTSLSTSRDKSEDNLISSQASQGSTDSQATQSSQSQPLSQFRGTSLMSSRVKAFAFITLGKLCLQNEDVAKKCVAALAREMETSTDPTIRNNVMIVMCDLCVRYTTTANHYISNIASCLKDPSPLVRKQTVTLVTRLLQEDFLKWKGTLFFRFISVLLDEVEEIRKFGDFCMVHMLVQRHPTMFYQHYMECVFHFNDYRQHSVYNQFVQSDKDRELFSLKGDKNAKKRLELYKFMLNQMSDNHKFQLQGKLSQEILGAIVDGLFPMNDDSSDILKDTLAILSSKEIKLSSLKVRPNEEMASDEQEMAAVVIATAKKTIITQVVKKNVIENIVPIVVSLKHMMEKQRSPLLKELLMYLRELMKDYKTEVKDILSADKQLATEIEFDLRKFEEQEEVARNRGAAPSVQGTPVPGAQLKSPVVNVRSPVTVGSPRTPALKRQDGPGSGTPVCGPQLKPATPIMKLVPGGARTGTPGREAPLSTLAVLNSARRMIDRPGGRGTPRVSNSPRVSTSPGSGASISGISAETTEEMTVEGGATPGSLAYRKVHRAISTPSVAMSNITFHGDGNMTFLPPSPIPENDQIQRVYDEPKTPVRIVNKKGGKKTSVQDENEDVLLVNLPLNKVVKPKVWNVTSPAPQKSKSRLSLHSEEESQIQLAPLKTVTTNENDAVDTDIQSKQSKNSNSMIGAQGAGDADISQSKRKSKNQSNASTDDLLLEAPVRRRRSKRT